MSHHPSTQVPAPCRRAFLPPLVSAAGAEFGGFARPGAWDLGAAVGGALTVGASSAHP